MMPKMKKMNAMMSQMTPHTFEENLTRNGLRSVHPAQARKGYDQRTLRRETAAYLRES